MKETAIKLLMAIIFTSLASPAQFDDEEDTEFIPPPPPPASAGRVSSPGRGASANEQGPGAQKDGEMLTTAKREQLAKASIDEITDENFPEIIESFDYPNADITDVIKAISELTGKNFIIDPAVRGKITIIAPSKISVAEAYRAFLSALAINGYTVVSSGNFLKVKSARNAQRDSIETYSGAYFPNSDQMITRIIHLKHISAEQVNRELRILASKDGEMSIYAPTNSIILSDFGSNIERVMKIINQLDVPGFEEKLVVIPIKHAKSKDIAELVNKIVNKDQPQTAGRAGTFTSGVPRFGGATASTRGSSGSAYFMVIPDDRTNSLIVVGNTPGIARIRKLIGQLDFKITPEESGGVYVYYVKHGEAEKIAQTLSGIAKEATKPTTPGPGAGAPAQASPAQEVFGGDVKITADKDTNSLIVTASKQDYDVVVNILSKIDIPRDQVYVEAIIMEMALDDLAQRGVGYFKYDKASGGMGRAGFNGFSSSDLQSLLNPVGGSGAILGFASGETVSIKSAAGASMEAKELLGFLNILKGIGRTNILSTPQIMALDNEEATIEVGDKIPTSQSLSTGANGVTTASATFEDATLKLTIKPFISPASDSIRLKIKQNIKQPNSKAQIPNTVALSTRSIDTNIVVPDGDTAVLGGLVRDEEVESVVKVPGLGDIPILGWLFSSRKLTKTKVNLIVFLTPKIVRNQKDRSELLGKKIDQRLHFIKTTGGRDPFGKQIEDLPKKTASASDLDVRKHSTEPIRLEKEAGPKPAEQKSSEGSSQELILEEEIDSLEFTTE